MPRVNVLSLLLVLVFVLVRCWSFYVLIYHIVLRLFVYFSLDFTHDLGPSLDLGHINSHHFAVVHIPQRIYTDVQTN